MKRFYALLLTLSLAAISCQFISPTQPPAAPSTEFPWDERAVYQGGLRPSAQPILNELAGASVYHLQFDIARDLAHVAGKQEVRYTNTEASELTEVRFRLFANIFGGKMTAENITVNGQAVTPSLQLNDSLLTVPLPEALAVGQSVIIAMDFALSVPESADLHYGVQAYDDDVLALAHAYPMIPVFDDEGWNAEIPPQSGDVTYADMSFFIVTVNAPKDITLVGAGREITRQEDGERQTVIYAAGPVRDFYLAASPDYEVFTKEANGITYRFYTRDFLQEAAEDALDAAVRAVTHFSRRYAPYPYSELDFVSTPTQALGIEYPGMIAITEWIIAPDNYYLEATIVHEVGHQWFYNLVGNDQLDDPWLDESLAQFVTLQYYQDEYGEGGYQGFRQSLDGQWTDVNRADIPVGLPVRAYSDVEYGAIVYGRGALFFEALREQIGEAAFDAFLKDYTESNAWEIATPEELQSIAEQQCGCDLALLFDEWIY